MWFRLKSDNPSMPCRPSPSTITTTHSPRAPQFYHCLFSLILPSHLFSRFTTFLPPSTPSLPPSLPRCLRRQAEELLRHRTRLPRLQSRPPPSQNGPQACRCRLCGQCHPILQRRLLPLPSRRSQGRGPPTRARPDYQPSLWQRVRNSCHGL